MTMIMFWLAATGALVLGILLARRGLHAPDFLDERAFGPGDVDAARYLSSGRIVWAHRAAANSKRPRSAARRQTPRRFAHG